jgi:hypothetical protein
MHITLKHTTALFDSEHKWIKKLNIRVYTLPWTQFTCTPTGFNLNYLPTDAQVRLKHVGVKLNGVQANVFTLMVFSFVNNRGIHL